MYAIISEIQHDWQQYLPEIPFDFTFLDLHLEIMYTDEARFANLISAFSWLSIFVACLGLYSLIAFVVNRRMKEISIRKVMGASFTEIMFLISKNFLGLIVIANLIAWPLAWIIMDYWLQNFAYRIEIRFWHLVLSGLIALSIAMATLSYQCFKAAKSNPITLLKQD